MAEHLKAELIAVSLMTKAEGSAVSDQKSGGRFLKWTQAKKLSFLINLLRKSRTMERKSSFIAHTRAAGRNCRGVTNGPSAADSARSKRAIAFYDQT